MLKLLLCLVITVSVCNSSKILGIVPTPSFSHQNAFRKIWQELSAKGHDVTVITADPTNNNNPNLKEIDISFTYHVLKKNNIYEYYIKNENNFFDFVKTFRRIQFEVSEMILSSSAVQDILNITEKYDVALIEGLFPEMYAIGKLHNCPVIAISSFDGLPSQHKIMGNPHHPIMYPDVVLPFLTNLSFKERLISVFYYLYMKYVYLPKSDAGKKLIMKKYFPDVTETVDELRNEIDMLFINVNPILQEIRPYGPNTIPIGGGNHIHPPKPLEKHIQTFLDDSPEGVIYFSLGSNVKSQNIGEAKLKAIVEVLKELPYKVLWKFEADGIFETPKNVKLLKWAPQQDILRHKNVKLFITQGGIQSIDESIYSHVPMVVMPFFGDQERNGKRLVMKGMGVLLKHKPLIPEEFKNAINEVMNNKQYYENVKRIADLSLDQPMSGVEKAIWWTEYVIRHKGAKQLRNPAIDIPLYQYFFLDIIGFMSIILIIIVYIFYWIIKLIRTKLFKKTTKTE